MAESNSPFADIESDAGKSAKASSGQTSQGQPSGQSPKKRGGIIAAIVVVVVVVALAVLVLPKITGTQTATSAATTTTASAAAASAAAEIPADEAISVTVTVDATEADEGMLFSGTVTVREGASAEDVLDATGLQVTKKSSASMGAYIAGVGDVMEKDGGSSSGWLFYVNGSMSMVSADSATVNDGDIVEWKWFVDGMSAPQTTDVASSAGTSSTASTASTATTTATSAS